MFVYAKRALKWNGRPSEVRPCEIWDLLQHPVLCAANLDQFAARYGFALHGLRRTDYHRVAKFLAGEKIHSQAFTYVARYGAHRVLPLLGSHAFIGRPFSSKLDFARVEPYGCWGLPFRSDGTILTPQRLTDEALALEIPEPDLAAVSRQGRSNRSTLLNHSLALILERVGSLRSFWARAYTELSLRRPEVLDQDGLDVHEFLPRVLADVHKAQAEDHLNNKRRVYLESRVLIDVLGRSVARSRKRALQH